MLAAILFDFDQTLVNSAEGFRAAEKEAQRAIFAELGGGDREAFLLAYRANREACFRAFNFSRVAVWQAVFKEYGREASARVLDSLEVDYWDRVAAATEPFPETVRVLARLQPFYRLGMVSNAQGGPATITTRLRRHGALAEFLQAVVVAGDGSLPPKPEPQAFRSCLDALEVNPEEAVYVGDDWTTDICGARRAGMRAIWLQHRSLSRTWPDAGPGVPIIRDLEELVPALDGV